MHNVALHPPPFFTLTTNRSASCFPMHFISKALPITVCRHSSLHHARCRLSSLYNHLQVPSATNPVQSRHVHMVSNMDLGTKYRQLRICEREDLVTGFETLLHLLRNPATAQHVHHLEVRGAREVTDREDPDFQRPPSETQELAEVDILNLRTDLRKAIFLSDQDSPENDELHYIPESYYHRINLVRRLPALESIAFTLATWNNEAGIPPPSRSANYSEISFTHSMMHEADLCCLLDCEAALMKYIRYLVIRES
ncbi:hypothetical protein BO82DRAFT_209431 [Aspergillus uvarum CBS 121591]|uniref:Uncharacterized protein n=1 Tax=Aspergillus uvarum CBS 121591 TaxID=1448315 RepID=A0A319CCC3_9EURO|nr:hypothetical protein BO82DRAFT_209431 [Aspergillus uvarum CBS 121591]PYH76263.1 hypothetical protein BO82DRAFT_209431 [Aspergillus uvarum CBS 121591]